MTFFDFKGTMFPTSNYCLWVTLISVSLRAMDCCLLVPCLQSSYNQENQDLYNSIRIHEESVKEPEMHKCMRVTGDIPVESISGKHVSEVDAQKRTLLHLAASRCNHEVIKVLLDYNADVNAVDDIGWTPLHMAVMHDHDVTIRRFLKHKADVNFKDNNGMSPLHWACKVNSLKAVQLLLKYKAFVDTRDHEGMTPLHWAANMGCDSIVRLLLVNQANASLTDTNGLTPLHYAAMGGYSKIIHNIVNDGYDPLLRSSWWNPWSTPAYYAQNKEIKSCLLSRACAIHLLWQAVLSDDVTRAQTALMDGAPVNVHTSFGITPLMIATCRGCTSMVIILAFYGATKIKKKNVTYMPSKNNVILISQ